MSAHSSFLLKNDVFLNSCKSGFTPTKIYQCLIDNGVVNPYTLKPYSVMTVRRLIRVVTNGMKINKINKSGLLNFEHFINLFKSGLYPSQIHLALIKAEVVNPYTKKPYSLMTVNRAVSLLKRDLKDPTPPSTALVIIVLPNDLCITFVILLRLIILLLRLVNLYLLNKLNSQYYLPILSNDFIVVRNTKIRCKFDFNNIKLT